jgi:virginiamycin B lyase
MRHREPARPVRRPLQSRGAVLAALVILAGCVSPAASPTPGESANDSQPPPSESAAPSPSGPPTARLEDVAAFDVPVVVAPDWPALLDDSLWVLAPDGPSPGVVRLDPASGAEQARVALPGGGCEMMAAGFESIWACTPDGLVRIDPGTNAIVASVAFQTPQLFGRFAVSDDAIWSLSGEIAGTDVVRIDPASNAVTATYSLGHAVGEIAYGLGYLWGTATRDGLLLRIDPVSGEVTTAASDLVDPFHLATGAGRVWVGLQGRQVEEDPEPSVADLFRYDPATETGDSFDFGMRSESVNDIRVTDDDAWVQAVEPFLMRLDPQSAAVDWIVTSDRGSGAIVGSDKTLWMTLWRANAVVRIDF